MTLVESEPTNPEEKTEEWIYDAPPGDSADNHVEYTAEDEPADDAGETAPPA